MINAKVIKNSDCLVNLCDNELINQRLNDCLISEDFYGEVMSEEEVIKALEQATVINALGEEAVSLVERVKGELNNTLLGGVLHTEWFLIK